MKHLLPSLSRSVRLFVLSAALINTACITPCICRAEDKEDLPQDMKRLLDSRKLVVAMHMEDVPPFFMQDDEGRLQGLDIELAYDIARNLGVDIEFKREAETFDQIIAMVASRKADIAISCVSNTRKRAIKVRFSTPYIKMYHSFLINRLRSTPFAKDKPLVSWLNSTAVAIGAVSGSAYVEFAQLDYPNAQIVQYKTWNDAAASVLNGEIHVAFSDNLEVLTWVNKHPEDVLYLQVKIRREKEDPIAVVTHWKDTHLLSWLNTYIEAISNDGSLAKLRAAFFKGDTWKEYNQRPQKQ